MVDRLGHGYNYRIVFFGKISFYLKKHANNQIPLKSPFDAPFFKQVWEPRMQNHIILYMSNQ